MRPPPPLSTPSARCQRRVIVWPTPFWGLNRYRYICIYRNIYIDRKFMTCCCQIYEWPSKPHRAASQRSGSTAYRLPPCPSFGSSTRFAFDRARAASGSVIMQKVVKFSYKQGRRAHCLGRCDYQQNIINNNNKGEEAEPTTTTTKKCAQHQQK